MNEIVARRPYSKDGRMPLTVRQIWIVAVVLFMAGPFTSFVRADEYVIGPEDILKISFWQDPTLDQVVTVRQDGKITLSIIGEVTATGLTSQELADKIEENVSIYNARISQAAVTVIGFNSQKVYISGEVNSPCKKTFEVIPDIWTVIKEAGGTTEFGDLTRVTIVRSGEAGGERITVNLLEAIAAGNLEKLPRLKVGDTIEIPRMVGGVPGRELTTDFAQRKSLYYIVGQVNMPGIKQFDEGIDLFDALGAAGGPTLAADLKNIRVVSKIGEGSSVITVNLKKYQADGQSRRVLVRPEDTIIIGEKSRSFLSWGQLRDFAAVAGTVISFIYLIDRR